jgi:hypothetical protein
VPAIETGVVGIPGAETEGVAMMIFGESDGTWIGVAFAAIAMVGTAVGLVVNATKERRMKRDALEFSAELVELKATNEELKEARDECVKQHAEKDERIGHLEVKLEECHKDHETSAKDRERLWNAIRAMQAGPV